MIRRMRGAGAALLALCALAAVSAPAGAFGAEATLTSTKGVYPVSLHGEQTGGKFKFTIGGNSLECETATFTGQLTAATGTVTLTPNLGGAGSCEMFGISGGTWTTGSCDLLLTTVESGETKADVSIACGSGEMTIDTPLNVCTTHIKAQNGLGQVGLANNGKHVDMTWAITGIHVVVTGFFCPTAAGTYNNASYTGSVTLKGAGEGVDGIDVS